MQKIVKEEPGLSRNETLPYTLLAPGTLRAYVKEMNDGSSALGNELIEYRASPIHGMGGFARRDIPAGETVIEYVGERITKEESLRRCASNNPFIFALDETHDLDGSIPSNPARFLNHSCRPNCEAIEDGGRIWIVSARPIHSGEELTFNYGYSLEEYDEHPCRCGESECVGFVLAEEFHETVRRKLENKAG